MNSDKTILSITKCKGFRNLWKVGPLTRASSAWKRAASAGPSSSSDWAVQKKQSSLAETQPSSGESCRKNEALSWMSGQETRCAEWIMKGSSEMQMNTKSIKQFISITVIELSRQRLFSPPLFFFFPNLSKLFQLHKSFYTTKK